MVCSWRSRGDLAIGSQFCRTQRQHFGILLHISPPAGGGPRAKGLSTCSMKTKKGEPYDPPNINRMQTDDSEEWTPQGPTLFEPDFDMAQHVTDAWKHWEQMGSPRFVMAPMVDQSELAFRAMGRKYGCDLAYTPMLHSKIFAETTRYRKDHFQTNAQDRPLAVQFCANNPTTLLKAARLVEDHCDAVDLNFGCPQDIARRGKYGSFLMDDWHRVHDLILTLKLNLKVPVWAKIRVFPDKEKTVAYAKMIEAAGASVICIHGRTREQKGNDPGPADLELIRDVAAQLRVPVIANGNIQCYDDALRVLKTTNCQAVMSAVGLLEQPAIFSGERPEPIEMAREYLHFADQYDAHFRMVRPHLFQMLYPHLRHRPDLLAKLAKTKQTDAGAVASYSPFLDLVLAEVGTLEEARAEQATMRELEAAAAEAAELAAANGDLLDASSDDGHVTVSLDGRTLKKRDYKALLRKQRTMQRTKQAFAAAAVVHGGKTAVNGGTSALNGGMAASRSLSPSLAASRSLSPSLASVPAASISMRHDPFSDSSKFYHKVAGDDPYGERLLDEFARSLKGEDQACFLIRRSNSDPFTAISMTYRDRTPTATYKHCKILREEPSHDGESGQWRMSSSWAGVREAAHSSASEGMEDDREAQVAGATLDELLQKVLMRHGYKGLAALPSMSNLSAVQ